MYRMYRYVLAGLLALLLTACSSTASTTGGSTPPAAAPTAVTISTVTNIVDITQDTTLTLSNGVKVGLHLTPQGVDVTLLLTSVKSFGGGDVLEGPCPTKKCAWELFVDNGSSTAALTVDESATATQLADESHVYPPSGGPLVQISFVPNTGTIVAGYS